MPGEFVYRILGNIHEYVLLFLIFIGRASISTFNIFYFFGTPIFHLAKKHRIAHAFWLIPSIILVGIPIYFVFTSISYKIKHESPEAAQIAEQEFKKITCKQVRENDGKETTYKINAYNVRVTFDYDFTGVWVTAPDGRKGSDGGPKYFCRPDYKGQRKE